MGPAWSDEAYQQSLLGNLFAPTVCVDQHLVAPVRVYATMRRTQRDRRPAERQARGLDPPLDMHEPSRGRRNTPRDEVVGKAAKGGGKTRDR